MPTHNSVIPMKGDLERARDFILRNARLLDRRRFAFRFDGGASHDVVTALRAYQNADGGFGHALEPDLRCSASQPVPVEQALHILDEVADFEPGIVQRCCDWLAHVATDAGGVPFALSTLAEGPHAPWWKASGNGSLNPTAGILGLLYKHRVTHAWIPRAAAYCWNALESDALNQVGPDDAISILTFLEHAPERERADAVFEILGKRICAELVALEPDAPGYVKMPLEFAPTPDRMARRLFGADTMSTHLDALEKRQSDDGGWPITWSPPSSAATSEWRAIVTIKWLDTLHAYGRLRTKAQ
jgi:hypothetical protein